MASRISSNRPTNGSLRSTRRRCTCPRLNPYGRSQRRNSAPISIPLDFPTYNQTFHPSFPSAATFNLDASTILDPQDTHQGGRTHRRVSSHNIRSDQDPHTTVRHHLESAPIGHGSPSFDPSTSPTPFRYSGEEETIEIHITRMRSIIKTFEKSFWQI